MGISENGARQRNVARHRRFRIAIGIPQGWYLPKRSGGALAPASGAQAIVSEAARPQPMAKSLTSSRGAASESIRLHFRPVSR